MPVFALLLLEVDVDAISAANLDDDEEASASAAAVTAAAEWESDSLETVTVARYRCTSPRSGSGQLRRGMQMLKSPCLAVKHSYSPASSSNGGRLVDDGGTLQGLGCTVPAIHRRTSRIGPGLPGSGRRRRSGT